jgi:hypothetical protein
MEPWWAAGGYDAGDEALTRLTQPPQPTQPHELPQTLNTAGDTPETPPTSAMAARWRRRTILRRARPVKAKLRALKAPEAHPERDKTLA